MTHTAPDIASADQASAGQTSADQLVITYNGEPRTFECPDATLSVAGLIAQAIGGHVSADVSDQPRGIAVALNGRVVPASAWADTAVESGAVVDVLGAVQGG